MAVARARKGKEKESKMVRASKARMAKALLGTLTKEKERVRARAMERDRGQRLRSFKVIAISAGSLDTKKVTAVRRKVVEGLTLERRVLDRLKKLVQQMVQHHMVLELRTVVQSR